jgi:hypothetical protein
MNAIIGTKDVVLDDQDDNEVESNRSAGQIKRAGIAVVVASLIAIGVWIVCLGIYAWAVGGADAFGIGLVVGVAALLAGALLGFIFAIPRNPSPPAGSSATGWYRSNSNLEEISDWLTKILVGLGLVQFGRLLDGSHTVVDSISAALGNETGSDTFAAAVLVIFSVTGFLSGYVITRVRLGPAFAQSEQAMRDYLDAIDQRVASVDEKVASVGEKVASVHEKVASVDEKVASVDEKVEAKMATVDEKVEASIATVDEKVDAKVAGMAERIDEMVDAKVRSLGR